MDSLEWRVKQLENKVFGQTSGLSYLDRIVTQPSHEAIFNRLQRVAKIYANYAQTEGEKYAKFRKLYENHRSYMDKIGGDPSYGVSDLAKAELVLAYEEDLTRHLEAISVVAEKAERVLDVKGWPDFRGYEDKLEKLEKITKEQHYQSLTVDKQTEELIEIYNDIISSFKNNIVIWNRKLEAYENEEKKQDDDE